ncbi:MAG: ABC transporter permease [Bacillota bacterium]
MSGFRRLFAGEMRRLVSYKILPVSFATSCLWVILLLFVSREDALFIAPLLVFVDITMMLILLIGASSHLEKQDGTIKSMLVMPVSIREILFSKIAASMVLGLESAIVMSAALFIIHGITFNYAALLLFVAIAGLAHAAIGFFLALCSKDFGSMLGLLMVYLLPFTVPTILLAFGVIDMKYEWIVMLSPSHSSSNLITAAILGSYDVGKALAACVYLMLLSAALLKFAVYPKFKDNAVRR